MWTPSYRDVRPAVRFLAGASLGSVGLAAYLLFVGPGEVTGRATAVAPWVVGVALALVVAEALVDGVGVWASVNPLGTGLSPARSVQFALAGDFFDTVSPAGPVSSEPIMARFFGVATGTTYSEALGVRGLAKYVKAATQLFASATVATALLFAGAAPRSVVVALGGAVVLLVLAGASLVRARAPASRAVVAVLAPIVARVSSLYRETPHDRAAVADAVDRFWTRALYFREAPGLLALIALAGVLEQVLIGGALWVALGGTGTGVALLPILAVIPLPRAASVIPIPASLGAYDVLLAGALVLVTGAPADGATAAVLVVRTLAVGVALLAGGLAVAFLRGWRLRAHRRNGDGGQ